MQEVYKAADMVVEKPTILLPEEYGFVQVIVGPGVLPSANAEDISSSGFAARSRVAQAGSAPDLGAVQQILASQVKDRFPNGGTVDHFFPAQIPFRNYTQRSLEFSKGLPIGKLFRTEKEPIVGEELEDLISAGAISLGDRSDRRRWKRKYKHVDGRKILQLVTLEIDRKRLGMKKNEKPLKLSDYQDLDIEEFRSVLDVEMEEKDPTDENVLWIANTQVEIGMPAGIDGILHKAVYSAPANRSVSTKIGEHIEARRLDGGRDPWPIRVEVWGKILSGLRSSYIDLSFYRAAKTTLTSRIERNGK